MTLFSRPARLTVLAVCVFVIAAFLTVCDDRTSQPENARKAEAQRQEQIQAQLQAEQAKRLEAEKSAQAAQSSRDAWIIGLGAGAGVVGIMAILIGIHIGSRALGRGRKEQSNG